MVRVLGRAWGMLFLLTLWAAAAEIPIGTITYLGDTTGGSVFHIVLNPPPGVSLAGLAPSLLTDGNGHSFALPAPISQDPLSYNFLLVTAPSNGFSRCPCRSVSLLFAARPATKLEFANKKFVLTRISASVLDPMSGKRFLVPQQSATIYLSTHGHKNVVLGQ